MFDDFLQILRKHSDSKGNSWLDEFFAEGREFNQRKFYYAFSGATRLFPKTPIAFAAPGSDASEADKTWTVDQLARSVMLQFLARQGEKLYLDSLKALVETADLRESVAIFSTFPYLPNPEELVPMAREGLRTNIVDVFDAIALNNTFPSRHFDEEGWNQMVLKAFFLSRPTYRIVGLDSRANPTLSEALSNYAHERWAAGRLISAEIWRSCQAFIDEGIAADLSQAVKSGQEGHREAAALCLSLGEVSVEVESLKQELATELAAVKSGELSWNSLGEKLLA